MSHLKAAVRALFNHRMPLKSVGAVKAHTLFLVLMASITQIASANSTDIDQLVAQAEAKALSNQPQWRKLIHYTPRWLRSDAGMIDHEAFYQSPQGKHDPAAELEATLRAFFRPLAEYKDPNTHPQCAYPARFAWLSTQLAIADSQLPEVPCARLRGWLAANQIKRVSLVFSSYYPNNPASMFGHTFLRLHREVANADASGLQDLSVNFAAFPDTMNPILYPLKGSSGFFPGRYQLMPYFVKVQEYANAERRDLWEYELGFSPKEIQFMLKALWEIGEYHYDYYYFDDNCSAIILTLLETVRPQLDLKNEFEAWVIPADTLREVARSPGLVRDVRYEPSILTRFLRRYAVLNEVEKNHVAAITEVGLATTNIDGVSLASQARILDTVADYIDFVDQVAGTSLGKENKDLRKEVLVARSRLSVKSPAIEFVPLDERPDRGHDSASLSLLAGSDGESPLYGFVWRPALHDLAASHLGYPEGLEIGFFHTEVRYDEAAKEIYMHDYSLLRIWSLPLSPWIVRKPAWNVDFASRAVWACGEGENERCQRHYVRGGGGTTLPLLGNKIALFGLGLAELGHSEQVRLKNYVGAGLAYGIWFNVHRDTKGLLRVESWKRFGDSAAVEHEATFEWSYATTEQQEIRLKAQGTSRRQEITMGYRLYY